VLQAFADQLLYPCLARRRNNRAHLDSLFESITDAKVRRQIYNRSRKGFGSFSHGNCGGNCQAALAGAPEGTVTDDLGTHFEIGVRHDDNIIFRTTLALDPLAVGSALGVHISGNRRRSDKADRFYIGVLEERVNRCFSSYNQIHNSFGNACFVQQFDKAGSRKRDSFGWLQDKCVSARYSVRQKPERNHGWKIERRYGRYHPERLANHNFVNPACRILQVVALHQYRNTARDFNVFDSPLQLCPRLRKGFPVFLRSETCDLVHVLLKQLLEPKEILNAVLRRSAAPRWERGRCSCHGIRHIIRPG
jgi:hypothetical protein